MKKLQKVKIDSLVGIIYDLDRLYTKLIYGHFHSGQKPYCRLTSKNKKLIVQFFSHQIFHPAKTPKELHDRYCNLKITNGWEYGETFDMSFKHDPNLVKYEDLSLAEQLRYVVFINYCEYLKKYFEIDTKSK